MKKIILIPILLTIIFLALFIPLRLVNTLLAVSQVGDIVEYRPPTVMVSGKRIYVTVYIRNTGDETFEGLIEVQPIPSQPLAWASPGSETCDIYHPENVHKDYRLTKGEQISFTIATPELTDGVYDVKLVSTDKCCVDKYGKPVTCEATGPYGWGKVVGTVTIPQTCDCHADYDCGNIVYKGCWDKKKHFDQPYCDCTCQVEEVTVDVECCEDNDCQSGYVCDNFYCVSGEDMCYAY
jgi:hypothetical protein